MLELYLGYFYVGTKNNTEIMNCTGMLEIIQFELNSWRKWSLMNMLVEMEFEVFSFANEQLNAKCFLNYKCNLIKYGNQMRFTKLNRYYEH